nr:TetR/AcrR family transcriptional regulator [Rhabdothermincola salaria]
MTAFAHTHDRVVTPFDIAATARGLLTERPWQELSIEEVATAAGISAGEIHRLFGSKHALGIGVFLMLADESFTSIPDGLDPITELRTMIALATALMERSQPLTQSAILVFAGMSESYAPGAVTWGPIPRIVALVGAAQQAGQLDPDLDTEAFAMAMLRTLLTHAQPAVRTGDLNPVDPTELMLLGAGAPPADDQAPIATLRTVS